MRTLADGTLQFEAGEKLPLLPYHFPNPLDPNNYIPKFEPCIQRTFQYKKESCGKIVGRWMCLFDSEGVSVRSCKQCTKSCPKIDTMQHTIVQ